MVLKRRQVKFRFFRNGSDTLSHIVAKIFCGDRCDGDRHNISVNRFFDNGSQVESLPFFYAVALGLAFGVCPNNFTYIHLRGRNHFVN